MAASPVTPEVPAGFKFDKKSSAEIPPGFSLEKKASPTVPPGFKLEKQADRSLLSEVWQEGIVSPARQLKKGYHESVAGGAHMLDNAAALLEKVTPGERGGFFGDIRDYHAARAAEIPDRQDVASKIYRGLGSAPAEVAKYTAATVMAGGNPVAGMASVGALQEADRGVVPALEGAAKGGLMGATLGTTAGYGMGTRVPVMATAGGGQAAAEGGDVSDVVSGAVTMGALGIPGAGNATPISVRRNPNIPQSFPVSAAARRGNAAEAAREAEAAVRSVPPRLDVAAMRQQGTAPLPAAPQPGPLRPPLRTRGPVVPPPAEPGRVVVPAEAAVAAEAPAAAPPKGRIRAGERGSLTLPQGLVEGVAEAVPRAREFGRRQKTEWIDKHDPILEMVEGKGLPAEADPYIAARMYSGHVGKIHNRLDSLRRGTLRPAERAGVLEDAVELAKLERFEELSQPVVEGGRTVRPAQEVFEGGKTISDVRAEREALEAKLGPEKLAQAQQVIESTREYTGGLLREAYDAGIFTDAAYNAIVRRNQKYIPLQRLEHVAEQMEANPGRFQTGSNALSVADQNIVQSITGKGSAKEVYNPLEQIIRNTGRTISLIERNKVAQKVGALSRNPDFQGTVIPVGDTGAVPKGMDTFSAIENGIVNKYAAPKEVVAAMKGLGDQQVDMATSMAALSSRALRAGATSMNAAFFIPNMVRDYQTAKLVSEVGFSVPDWLRGMASAIKRDADFKRYMEDGASFSGYFERQKDLSKTLSQLKESEGSRIAKTVLNPIELMRVVGETTELAPRIGVYQRGLREGLPPTEAAFNSRNATIDFAKMGNKMRIANMWIPFLNARTQGTWNSISAAKRNPAEFAKVASYLIAVPAIATYVNNVENYPEVWEDIKPWEKEANFIFIYGDEKDENGNYTQVAKMPKGDVGRVVGNPLENFMEYITDHDPNSAREILLQVTSDLSPIGFEREGKVSGSRALAGVLPPVARGAAEVVANRKFYFDSPIIPRYLEGASPSEQYTASTPTLLVRGAEALSRITEPIMGTEVSPLNLGHAIEAQLGGVGRQITKGEHPGQAIARRFSGAQGGQQENLRFERLDEIRRKHKDQSTRIDREARRLFAEMQELDPAQRRQMAQGIAGQPDGEDILEEVVSLAESEEEGLTAYERSLRRSPVNVRADVVFEELNALPMSERAARLTQLQESRIVTKAVEGRLMELFNAAP